MSGSALAPSWLGLSHAPLHYTPPLNDPSLAGAHLDFPFFGQSQWEASQALQHATEALLAASTKVRPEDQRRQEATRAMFEAVGSVLEASLSHGSEELMEANSSQVGTLDQMQASCMLHARLMPVLLGRSFTPNSRWLVSHRGYSASRRLGGRLEKASMASTRHTEQGPALSESHLTLGSQATQLP